jgi:hypothetical protein
VVLETSVWIDVVSQITEAYSMVLGEFSAASMTQQLRFDKDIRTSTAAALGIVQP